jgi:hypothetical protein
MDDDDDPWIVCDADGNCTNADNLPPCGPGTGADNSCEITVNPTRNVPYAGNLTLVSFSFSTAGGASGGVGSPQSKSPSPAAKPNPTGLCRLGNVAQGSATNLGRVAGGLTVGGLIQNPLSPELLLTGTAFGVTAFGLDMTGVVLSAAFCAVG